MLHIFSYTTTITNLIIGDKYRFEAAVDVSSSRSASVDPTITEFIASQSSQNIALIIRKDTEDVIVLKTKTINITKNITNADQIIIKCSELDLCRPTPTPTIASN